MKKILCLLFLLIGCTNLSNTPTRQSEEFLKNYQTLDDKVITDLNNVVAKKEELTSEQKEKYKDIMKKHYKNLAYKVEDETIDGDSAVVEVEIEVTNFKKVNEETKQYLINNSEKFYDENGIYDSKLYNDYYLGKLEEQKEKIKYTIYLSLTNVNNKWNLNEISDSIYDKINGIYKY